MKRRTRLLATVGAGALIAAFGSRALAFDHVNWHWEKWVTVNEYIEIIVFDYFDFSGLLELEKWQLSFGDISARAVVDGVYNNPPAGGGGGGPQTANVDGTLLYTPSNGGSVNPLDAGQTLASDNPNITITAIAGNVDENETDESGKGEIDIQFTVNVAATDPSDALDAADLPGILNRATAVANNQSITTTTAVMLHDLQIAAGDLGYGDLWWDDYGWNSSHEVAGYVFLAALYGYIQPANITAYASVSNILNAFVDNAATAVGNNLSITMNAATPGDGFFIGDVTQLLIGDVSAGAHVSNVVINNYAGFGAAGFGVGGTPIVSNVATAVGNNFVINIDNCTLCESAPPPPPM